MNTTTTILRSEITATALRWKLRLCGSRTNSGHWYWCRNPACDRCRRYRARLVADNASYWAAAQNSCALRRLSAGTAAFDNPAALLAGIQRARRQIRGMFDRRQRQNDGRWSHLKIFGFFTPQYDGRWSAQFRGILHLGRMHEVTLLNAVEPLLPFCLQPIHGIPAATEVHAHIYRAVADTSGLLTCGADQIALWFNAVHEVAGYKSLVFRRGLQA